jgi:hypothetical protein
VKPTEFQLAVECCRSAFTGQASPRLAELTARVDWPRFVRLLRFHRVQGLAWNRLSSSRVAVPAEVAATLATDAKFLAASNLKAAEESRELLGQFERAGIPLLFIKGLTLGALAYPKPFLKMAWDIDVLIGEQHLDQAAAELRARGYERAIPAPSADLKNWHRTRKESVWAKADEGLYVELHTRLADNRLLIPRVGMDSPRQDVMLPTGTSLPTLAEDELFAYLCVHGASSLWFRLKWITDLAALIHRLPHGEIERLYDRSLQLGAGRASAQALIHADDVYGVLAGTILRSRLARDRMSRWLADAAMMQVAGRGEPRDPTMTPLGTVGIHLSQLLLRPGLRFKLGELARQARDILSR